MIAALLRCIESLGAIGNIYNSTIWGIREVFVGICAVCAPGIWSFFKALKEKQAAHRPIRSPGGDSEAKGQNSPSSGASSSGSHGTCAQNDRIMTMGAGLTRETRYRDTLEMIDNPLDMDGLQPPNLQRFTATQPRLWSSNPQSSRPPFFRRMPLSVILSDSNSGMSVSSNKTSTHNRDSLHSSANTSTIEIMEPLRVYISNGSGLQEEIETDLPHIYRREGEVDLERGECEVCRERRERRGS